LNADCVIVDLETAISESEKAKGRENVSEVLPDIEFGDTEVCVRINGIDTDWWLQDLCAAIEAAVDTVRIPMVEDAWEVRAVVETAKGVGATNLEFLLMLETPQGFLNGHDIAKTSAELSNVTGLSLGGGDYSLTIGAPELSTPVRDYLRNQIVTLASVGNMDPIAGVYMTLNDEAGLREFAERAAAFGFVGMSAVSPDQVETINDVFTPSEEEVGRAHELVQAFEASEKDGIVVDGLLLEEPIVNRYRKIIEQYESLTK